MTEEELELAEEINQLSNNFEENKDRVVEIARILTAKLNWKILDDNKEEWKDSACVAECISQKNQTDSDVINAKKE